MDVGQLIEFLVSDGHRIGVVTGILNRKKIIVLTADGTEVRSSPKNVTFEAPGERIDLSIPGEFDRALGQFTTELATAHNAVDLEQVWEEASKLGAARTIEQLADMAFGSTHPAQLLAMQQALREDGTYFKYKRDSWKPRTPELLAQLRQQEAAAARREAELGNFLRAVASAQNLPERTQRAELIREQARLDDHVRDSLALLQEYGASDDMFERRERADDLLDELDEHPGAKVHGSGPLRAFNLMVDLGLWTRHENTLLYRHHINTNIPATLLVEAHEIAAQPWEPEPWRKDLTRTLCVTIDDASTLDMDDALSCVPREDGGWDMGIHIADPSAFVPAGSPLDLSARDRGTSIYLPTGTIPMFPSELSEGAMSLVAGELRPAMTTMVQIDRDLNILGVEVYASVVKVDHRMSYDEVDAILEHDAHRPVDVALRDLAFLTSELFYQREAQGAVSFDIPEAKIVVTPASAASGADMDEVAPEVSVELLSGDSPSRTLVAEAMIQASANMARFCHRNQIPVIYRCQDAPDEELFDEDVMAMPEGVPRFFAMRRKMKRGSITTHPRRHFGLGLDMYVQATSPIRRYSDLICQRQVKAFLTGEALPYSPDEILQIAVDVESASGDAIRASRGTQHYWTCHYLATRKGERLEATVLSHRDNYTAFVFLHALAMSVKCTMHRRYEPGEVIQVIVDRVHPRREILRIKQA